MLSKYNDFITKLSINIYGKTGVVLTTSSFITFIILEIARLAGALTNSYIGLITYLSLPTLFVIGLILIPIGWYKQKKATGKHTRELLKERFDSTDVKESFFGSKLFLRIVVLTLANVLFLVIASSQMLHFMDEPKFCGTACHSVMNPEWVTYQQSPHARVKCVECHVGEGVDALVASKLNGAYQMISVTFDLLERPIPTPVHQLRPARETCEKCHWPEKFYGNKLKTIVHYERNDISTPLYTTLNLKIDDGKGNKRAGIHWHISEENEIRYASVDDKREEMIWVEVRQPDSSYKRYTNQRIKNEAATGALDDTRIMDCVDCHNRATHIYEDPENALDERIYRGQIDRTLPYIKREGLSALTKDYPTKDAGMEAIATHLRGYYQWNHPQLASQRMTAIDSAIAVLQSIYDRNIHQGMNIIWGSYPNHIGHQDGGGCFRCHNPNMVADDKTKISQDCTTCHSILADGENVPFKYLNPVDEKERDSQMHQYLQEEFLNSFKNN